MDDLLVDTGHQGVNCNDLHTSFICMITIEAYLYPLQISMMKHFCKILIFVKKLHHKCSTGLYFPSTSLE